MIDRRYFRCFDWTGFFLILTLSFISLLFVYSATFRPGQPPLPFFNRQLFGILSGLGIFLFMTCIDYRQLQRWGYLLFFVTLALLVFTLFKGSIGLGGQRWINLGFIKFQPSELAKLFFPAFFTYSISLNRNKNRSFGYFIPLLIILGVSTILILKQPDLGTAIIVGSSGLLLMWFAGIGKKFFLWLFLLICVTAPITWACLKPYQKQRITVFFGEGDSRKERYQIEQSCIAIGSGGMWGKGYLQGTQNILQFLPESRTDFIFSVICEEWGFIGALFVIFIYLILFFRAFFVIATIKDYYAQLLAIGLIVHILFSTIINMGMVTGLLPIVGIPLPLISFGGTNAWITFASLGWFNSIAIRRFYHTEL
jgi:rod shape determining protein RodA